MNTQEREESAKWLKLAYETYGPAGVAAIAQAMGLPRARFDGRFAQRTRAAGGPYRDWDNNPR